MGSALIRFGWDGIYVIFFFAVMSAVASSAQWVVIQCEHRHIDPIILLILKGVSYVLAALDAVGVVTAAIFLTFRFILAIVRADA